MQHFVALSPYSLTTQRTTNSLTAAAYPSKWKCGTGIIKHLVSVPMVKATLAIRGVFQQ